MIKAVTLRAFPSAMNSRECFRLAKRIGYEGVELNFDGRLRLDISPEELKELKKEAGRCDIKIVSVYSREQWDYPISSADEKKRKQGTEILRRLIEIAEFLETEIILTIPGAVDNSIISREVEITPYMDVYARAQETLFRLSSFAEDKGVTMAIENVANKFLLSPLEMRHFIEEINSQCVGCYFDVANCLFCGGIPEDWIRILGHHIKSLHLKDYRTSSGSLSGFTNIFEGDVHWDVICRRLAENHYDGPLVSEVLPPFRNHPEVLLKSVSIAIDCVRNDIRESMR